QLTDAATEAGVAAESQELMNIAMSDTGPAAETAVEGLDELETAAAEAEQALAGTAQSLFDVGAAAMSLGDAKDRALSAINAMAEAAKAEGAAIDGTDDASIRLRDSLRDVEQAHRDSAA